MNLLDIKKLLSEHGFEIHGCLKGRSGKCHVIGSTRRNWDHGDKECRNFVAARINDDDAEWVEFRFSVSRSALACSWVKELTSNPEDFLLSAGILKFKQFLDENDSSGRQGEIMLHSASPHEEFKTIDISALRTESDRIKKVILELLWQSRLSGASRVDKQLVEESACGLSSVVDSVLDHLEQRKFIKGAYGSSGIKITVEGETYLDGLDTKGYVSSQIFNYSKVGEHKYDLFISHASEDKVSFVQALAEALKNAGLKVWYDEYSLKLGNSLRENIDRGLVESKRGLVVLSHNFFAKNWPQKELNGLFATMHTSGNRILPIWHEISADEVAKYSPMMADLLAANSSIGIEKVVALVMDACSDP